MKEKIKPQKGFIQIPLLIAIIVSIAVISVGGYGGFEYYKTSKIIKEAEQLSKEEKYEEAIEKLNLAQVSLFVKNLGIKKQEISDKQEETKKLVEDLSKYNQGLNEFDKGNYQEAIDLFFEIPEDSFYSNNAKLKTEEAKRKMVEEELGETKIAKEKAEEKAQQEAIKRSQEEMARKAKEQELATKEAQEKMMNTDNDGDGLTYRRELELGTSDWDVDSDGDGIKDNEDLHPAGGGRYIAQEFEWDYGGNHWTWKYPIHEDWYEYYKRKPRTSHGLEYVTTNDPFIKEVAKMLKETAQKEGYVVSLFITSFVQSLPYVEDAYTTFDEYPKYPIETFVERNGDCEDTSYLLASLIDASGYGSALVVLSNHMATAIKSSSGFGGSYYEMDDGRYYYVETTGKGWGLGNMPSEYKYQQAKIIKIWDGKTIYSYPKYQKPCDPSPDFPGYYSDGENFYSDSQCNYLTYCLPFKEFYVNPQTLSFYWDSSCSQVAVKGCSKSTAYPGYFFDGLDYYSDSRCIQRARICRPSSIYYDRYYDGYDTYWDSSCTQRVVLGCSKSSIYPGLFFDGWSWYYDYQCTQKAR